MSSIVKNKSVSFLDPRVKPQWELLDLREETGDYEHELFSSVICEFTDISGFDIEIYLMEPKAIDHVYGESNIKGYDGPFKTKLLYPPETEQTLIDTFGFSGDSTVQYAELPKAMWIRDVIEILDKSEDISYDVEYRTPRPGDLVKTLWDNSIFEITHVSTSEKIFSGKKLIWSFVLKPYRYDYESSDAHEILYEELNIDDFPNVNNTRDKLTEDQLHIERNYVKDEAGKNDIYDEVDTSVYGYFVRKS